jgi:hypothetical protein
LFLLVLLLSLELPAFESPTGTGFINPTSGSCLRMLVMDVASVIDVVVVVFVMSFSVPSLSSFRLLPLLVLSTEKSTTAVVVGIIEKWGGRGSDDDDDGDGDDENDDDDDSPRTLSSIVTIKYVCCATE